MAIGDAYATPDQLEERVNKSDTDPYDANYLRLLDAASREVETFTGRQFNKTDTASVRRFRATDRCRLPVDDFYEDDDLTVTVDGTLWESDTYEAHPVGGFRHGQPGWPFCELFTIGRRWPLSRRPLIDVAAKWGWDDVPSGVVLATLDVATAMYSGSYSAGPVRSESIDGYSVSYATVAGRSADGDDVPPEFVHAAPYRRTFTGTGRKFGFA